MKQKSLLKVFFLLCALIVGSTSVWATDYTWTTANGQLTTSTTSFTVNEVTWNFTPTWSDNTKKYVGWSGGSINCYQIGSSKNILTSLSISTSGIAGTITGVQIKWSSCASNDATLSVSVGSSNFTCNESTTASSSSSTIGTSNFTGSASGTVSLNFTSTTGIKLQQVVVTYSTGGDPTAPSATLDKTSLDFGKVNFGKTKALTFKVTPANLTGNLTIACDNLKYEVTPTSIAQATTTAQTITVTAKPTAIDDDMDGTITISGGGLAANKTVTLSTTVTDPNANDGSETKPFTVAEAIANTPTSGTSENYYIKGIVSQFHGDDIVSDGTNYRYYISDDGTTKDQLLVYKGKGLNEVAFSDADDLLIGDQVVILGSLTTFSNAPEIAANNYITSLVRPAASPSISANDVEIEYDATAGTIESTINNSVDGGVLTAAKKTEADWLTLGSVSGTNVPFTTTANEGNEDREATVTLTYTYGSPASTVTKDVTITQGHFVADYAVLPFTFNGGKADIETTTGLTQSGLGSDYGSSPKLKFDGTGDYLVLKINETPGTLSFDIKGNGFSGGTFKVQASSDGENYTDVATYTSLDNTENKEIDNLTSDVRYIKWIYTEKSSGNVALGNISLVKPATPKTATTTTIDATGITNTNLDEGTAAGQLTASVKAGDDPVVGATVAWTSSDEKVATVDAEGNVTLKKKGTTTITATYAGDETYASSSDTYKLTVTSEIQPTAIVSDFNYSTIGSGEGAELSEETAIDLDGVMMTLDKGNNIHYPRGDANYIRFYQYNTMKLEAPAGYVITSVEFTEPSTNRAWSDLNVDAGIYTNEGNGDGGSWEGVTSTLTFTGKDGACRMAGINITLAPGTNVTDAEWATYVTVVNTDFAKSTGIKAYKAVSTTTEGIKLEEISEAPKGTAVVIAASEKGYVLTEAASTPAAVTGNILQVSDGTITGDYNSDTKESTYYVLGKNSSDEVGFAPLAKGVKLAKGKAYIHKNDWDTATAKDFLPFIINEESETTSINSIENSELRIENYDYFNLSGQRVSKDYKGIVVVNGKKFVRK